MNQTSLKTLLVRNIGLWIVAALAYPIAHWIPTATGHPPRIFDVLISVIVLGLGLTSNAVLAAALRAERRDPVVNAEPLLMSGPSKSEATSRDR